MDSAEKLQDSPQDQCVARPPCVFISFRVRYRFILYELREKMAKIKDGIIVDKTVDVKTYASIEHSGLNKVTSIVLHRTDSSNAKSTIQAYARGRKFGAHFLIGKNGKIY